MSEDAQKNGHVNGTRRRTVDTGALVERHTFIVYAEDEPGVLDRIASLFRRRTYNIESINAGRTDTAGVSRLTIVMEADQITARLVEANLYKLMNVLRVHDVTREPSLSRELALLKIGAGGDARAQVMQLIEVFRARVVDVGPEAMVVEITGTEDKIQGLIDVVRPFGIIEMVRTGVISMSRGPDAVSVEPGFVHARIQQNGQH